MRQTSAPRRCTSCRARATGLNRFLFCLTCWRSLADDLRQRLLWAWEDDVDLEIDAAKSAALRFLAR